MRSPKIMRGFGVPGTGTDLHNKIAPSTGESSGNYDKDMEIKSENETDPNTDEVEGEKKMDVENSNERDDDEQKIQTEINEIMETNANKASSSCGTNR